MLLLYGMDAENKEPKFNLEHLMKTYERALIRQALEEANYCKAVAARLLGIPRTRLVEKIRRIPDLKHLIRRPTYVQYRATSARLDKLNSKKPPITDGESE